MEAAAVHTRGPAVIRLWQAILVAGLVVLALSYVGHISPGGTRLYETWLYEGVELLAALGCLTRAVLVRAERSAWFFIGAALLATTLRRHPLRLLVRRQSAVPVRSRRRLPRLLPAPLRRDRALAPPARLDLQRDPLARRAPRGDRCGSARRLGARRGRRQLHARQPARRPDEHRVPDRGRAPAGAPRLRLLGDAVAARARVGADRGRAGLQHGRRRDLPLPDRGRDLRRRHVPRSRLAALARPHRARRLAASRARPAGRAPGSRHARHADRVRTDCDRSARRSVAGSRAPARARVRQRDDRARPGADGADLLGELPAARDQPPARRSRTRSPALANRRKLLVDLEAELESASEGEPRMLVLFDLNGFKTYNDTFGHPAGDALLARLAAKLAAAVEPGGAAYRMGGDEFCVLLPAPEPDIHRIAQALWESGEGFDVTSAYGAALIPGRRDDGLDGAERRRRAAVRPQGAAGRDPPRDGARAAAAHARRAGAGAPRPRGRRLVARGARGTAARSRARRARGAEAGGRAARRRQARDPGRRPAEVRLARSDRVGLHPLPHADRTADPRRRPGAAAGRRDRPLDPRELGRHRLSRRARRRGDPARGPDHRVSATRTRR